MLVMVEYIPFTVHQYIWSEGRPVTERYAWSGTVLVWFHSNLSVVIHNVSVWLTLTLAVWRFIMIKYHALAPVYCTMARCKMVIVLAYGEDSLFLLKARTAVYASADGDTFHVGWSLRLFCQPRRQMKDVDLEFAKLGSV